MLSDKCIAIKLETEKTFLEADSACKDDGGFLAAPTTIKDVRYVLLLTFLMRKRFPVLLFSSFPLQLLSLEELLMETFKGDETYFNFSLPRFWVGYNEYNLDSFSSVLEHALPDNGRVQINM